MISKTPPFKGLNMRIPIVLPITGRGFINLWSGSGCCMPGVDDNN